MVIRHESVDIPKRPFEDNFYGSQWGNWGVSKTEIKDKSREKNGERERERESLHAILWASEKK